MDYREGSRWMHALHDVAEVSDRDAIDFALVGLVKKSGSMITSLSDA